MAYINGARTNFAFLKGEKGTTKKGVLHCLHGCVLSEGEWTKEEVGELFNITPDVYDCVYANGDVYRVTEETDTTYTFVKMFSLPHAITNAEIVEMKGNITAIENGGSGANYYYNDSSTSSITFYDFMSENYHKEMDLVDSITGTTFNVGDLIIEKLTDGRIFFIQVSGKDETLRMYNYTNLCGTELVGRQYGDCAGLVVANMNSASPIYATANGVLNLGNNNTRISNKSDANAIRNCDFDYAVKVGLTTNTETLTDEEKSTAQAWLGIKSPPQLYKHSIVVHTTMGLVGSGDTQGEDWYFEAINENPNAYSTSNIFAVTPVKGEVLVTAAYPAAPMFLGSTGSYPCRLLYLNADTGGISTWMLGDSDITDTVTAL